MNKKNYVFAFPGATLILMGVFALAFPKLIIFLMATLLIAIGCAALALGWQFYKMKQKADVMFSNFKNQAFEIRSFSVQSPLSDFEETKPRRTKEDIIVH